MKRKIFLLATILLLVTTVSAQTYFYTFSGSVSDPVENYVKTSTYPTTIVVLSETVFIRDWSGSYNFPILYTVPTQAYTDYLININGTVCALRICKTISILVIGQKVNIYSN